MEIKTKRKSIVNSKMKHCYRVLAGIFCFMIFTKNAYAYLDPGTGSYIIQVLIGTLMGGIITIKVFWKSIRDFFKRHLKFKKR